MKKVIDLALRRSNSEDRYELFSDTGKHPADLVEMLNELFKESTENLIAVRVIADDMTEKEVPFSWELAVEIINGNKKGEILTADGEKINLLASGLDDDYDLLGVYNNQPMQWSSSGLAKNRDQKLTLKKIIIKIK